MDEIFGPRNALGSMVWKRRSSSAMRGMPLSVDHEYLLVYASDSDRTTLYGLAKGVEDYQRRRKGALCQHRSYRWHGKGRTTWPVYPITNPRTGKIYQPNPERVWRFWPETMTKIILEGLVIWPDEVGGKMERPRFKTYFDPTRRNRSPVVKLVVIETANTNDREIEENEAEYETTILTSGMTQEGGKLLHQMMGSKIFAYPKPLSLVRSIIRATTRGDDLVLDSFAGTGTTGHAVLDLNHEDGGNRRFILAEMESDICEGITRERLSKAINGYTYEKAKGGQTQVEGLGGGFRYCRLGTPVFDEAGNIPKEVTFAELARTSTLRRPANRSRNEPTGSPRSWVSATARGSTCSTTAYWATRARTAAMF